MQEFNLKDQKQIFKTAFAAGDFETAKAASESIIENAPESVYGYYYALVLMTDNFTSLKNANESFEETFQKFLSLSTEETANKYVEKVEALKKAKSAEVKKQKSQKQKKTAKQKLNKLCLCVVSAICFVFLLGVIIPSAIYSANSPSSSYQSVKWDSGDYDSVIFELTKDTDNGDESVGDIWLNLGTVNGKTEVSFYVTSNTLGLTNSYYTTYNGGEKTLTVDTDNSGGWVRLTAMSTSSSFRKYFQISTKQEVRINEVVFLNQDGKVIKAEVKYAGPNKNANSTSEPSSTITSKIYDYRVKAAAALLDEQDKFNYSCVKDGVYNTKYAALSQREAVTLESVLNILYGGDFVDDTVNPLGLQLISVGVAVFGGNVLGLRIIPALFSVATILLIFFIGRKIFANDYSGLIFAALYAVSGFALSLAGFGGVDAIFVFFALLSVAFMYKFYDKVLSRRTGFKYYLPLMLSGISFAVALSVKMQALFVLVALIVIFVLALVKQSKLKTLSGYEYERKFNLSLVTFIISFLVAGVVWTGLTYVFSISVYSSYYAGTTFGGMIRKIFTMQSRAVETAYSTQNASNIFANLLGYKAEKLSASHYLFGNTVISALALFSFVYCTVYVMYSLITNTDDVKTGAFKKDTLIPYIALAIPFVITWALSALDANCALSTFALSSIFYIGFIVLALNNLAKLGKKVYKEVSIAHIVFGAVALFALVVFGFAVVKYLGIAVSTYPLNIGAFRW